MHDINTDELLWDFYFRRGLRTFMEEATVNFPTWDVTKKVEKSWAGVRQGQEKCSR